jgi:nuclease S1
MNASSRLATLIAAAAIHFSAPGAQSWDAAGHMLVGQIAWEMSSPEVREKVNALVAGLNNRFNEGQAYNFTTIGCWMDDLRSLPRNEYPWSKWHYVDGPKTADGSAFKLPEPPHVVWAIAENLRVLRDAHAPKDQRAIALGQLIHWVGDIHQPLHATTWDDRGGNGYGIVGPKFSDLLPRMSANLHTYWDKAFRFDARNGEIVEAWFGPSLADRPQSPTEGVIWEQAKRLIEKYPVADLPELAQPLDAEAWARESHILGCTKAYPPGEHPRDTEVRKLEPEWIAATRPVAERRVVIAGHRLAALLKELLKDPVPNVPLPDGAR